MRHAPQRAESREQEGGSAAGLQDQQTPGSGQSCGNELESESDGRDADEREHRKAIKKYMDQTEIGLKELEARIEEEEREAAKEGSVWQRLQIESPR